MTKPHGDNPCGLNFTVIFRGNAVKRDSRRLYRQYHKTIRLMKKLFRLFLCLALFSGTAACSDDEASQNLIVINGGEHFLSLDGLARAGKISVLAPAPWRVTKAAGDTWFTLSATEGPAGYSEVELASTRIRVPHAAPSSPLHAGMRSYPSACRREPCRPAMTPPIIIST